MPWQKNATVATEDGEVNLDQADLGRARALFGALPLEERNAISLSADDYKGLGAERGNVVADLDAWSPWSSPYELGTQLTEAEIEDSQLGVPIVSPGPRRYIQFRIDFSARTWSGHRYRPAGLYRGLAAAGRADSSARSFRGRSDLGEPVDFVYAVMPTSIRPGVDTGFDGLRSPRRYRCKSLSPSKSSMPMARLRPWTFQWPILLRCQLPTRPDALPLSRSMRAAFACVFPHCRKRAGDWADGPTQNSLSQPRVALRHKFAGFAFNSAEGDVGQEVVAGNVAALAPGDDDIVAVGTETNRGLSVDVPLAGGSALLINVRADPRPLQPQRRRSQRRDVRVLRSEPFGSARPRSMWTSSIWPDAGCASYFPASGRRLVRHALGRRGCERGRAAAGHLLRARNASQRYRAAKARLEL